MMGIKDPKKAVELMLSVPKQGGLEGEREMQAAPKNVGTELCVKDLFNAIQDRDAHRFLEAFKMLNYLVKEGEEESEEEETEE